jgi:hypothetical protein
MTPPLNRPETDIDRILRMLITDFPCNFYVWKGGEQLRLDINNTGKCLVLHRDGTYVYEYDRN